MLFPMNCRAMRYLFWVGHKLALKLVPFSSDHPLKEILSFTYSTVKCIYCISAFLPGVSKNLSTDTTKRLMCSTAAPNLVCIIDQHRSEDPPTAPTATYASETWKIKTGFA